jgi:nicotinamidase-related amidase
MTEAFLRGPLGPATVHLCIDMQRLLAPEGPWPTPWMLSALERQFRLISHNKGATVFTRFIPPSSPEEMPGTWRRYYEKWRRVTREFLDPSLLDLVAPLAQFTPPAIMIEKTRYSAFLQTRLQATLIQKGVDTLISRAQRPTSVYLPRC